MFLIPASYTLEKKKKNNWGHFVFSEGCSSALDAGVLAIFNTREKENEMGDRFYTKHAL